MVTPQRIIKSVRSVKRVLQRIANTNDLDHLIMEVTAAHGKIDVLFAKIDMAQGETLGQITKASFHQVYARNVNETIFLLQKVFSVIKSGGSIILAGSSSGLQGRRAMGIYNSTKAVIRSLPKT